MIDQLYIYAAVISEGPLIIVRVPAKGRRGNRRNAVSSRVIVPAMHALLRGFGVPAKGVHALDAVAHPDEFDTDSPWVSDKNRAEALAIYKRAQEAFAGDTTLLSKFMLYDWDEPSRSFVCVRSAGVL